MVEDNNISAYINGGRRLVLAVFVNHLEGEMINESFAIWLVGGFRRVLGSSTVDLSPSPYDTPSTF